MGRRYSIGREIARRFPCCRLDKADQMAMMGARSLLRALVLGTILVAGLLGPSPSSAATTCDPWVAKMVSLQGHVEVSRAGQTQWQPARLNDLYCTGDRIQVGERSRADIVLANQPVLRLDQHTTITLGGLKEQRTSLIELIRGDRKSVV